MHTRGRFLYASRTMDDELCITLAVEDFDKSLADVELDIEIEKHSDKKSMKALRYFWKLCTLIAQSIQSDKDTIYLLQLQKYGDYADISIPEGSIEGMRKQFRFIEVLDHFDNQYYVRCYYGLSTYSQDEMRHLLDGTVRDAQDLGIQTWDEAEIESLINNWKGTA